MVSKNKIFLYVHDEKWFGHMSRMLKIYKALEDSYSVCILLWWKLNIIDESISYIRLPEATEFEDINTQQNENRRKLNRINFLKKKLYLENNFTLLIDYFPFGRHAFFQELDILISITHDKGGKVYSIMRDIFTWVDCRDRLYYAQSYNLAKEKYSSYSHSYIYNNLQRSVYNYLSKTWYKHWAINAFIKNYLSLSKIDNILVFGDATVYDIRKEFLLNKEEEKKIIFLGYILSPIRNKWLLSTNKEKPYILISPWWNIFNKSILINLLVVCSKLTNIHFKIILWNMSNQWFRNTLKDRFNFPNFEFISFQNDIHLLMSQCRIFIWGWWYGTFCDIIKYSKKSLLFVNHDSVVNVNKSEQQTRITILEKIWLAERFDLLDNAQLTNRILTNYYSDFSETCDTSWINISWYTNIKNFLWREE